MFEENYFGKKFYESTEDIKTADDFPDIQGPEIEELSREKIIEKINNINEIKKEILKRYEGKELPKAVEEEIHKFDVSINNLKNKL